MLHRTKTLTLAKTSSDDDGIDDCSSGDMFKGGDDNGGAEEEEEHMMHCSITPEQVFTVNDDSLFLFKTTMKQLVMATSMINSHPTTTTMADYEIRPFSPRQCQTAQSIEQPVVMGHDHARSWGV